MIVSQKQAEVIYLLSIKLLLFGKNLDFFNGVISLMTNVHQTNLHSGFSDQVVHLTGTVQVIHCANLSADTLFSWDLTPEFYKE